jgi:glycolate oxidase FAD binding subunit
MAEATGPVVFNAGAFVHPFGLPTPYRRFRMKGIADEHSAQGDAAELPITDEELDVLSHTTCVSLDQYRGIIEHDIDDQVVVVRAGTSIEELQEELALVGQCLPMPMFKTAARAIAVAAFYGPLIDEIGFNLPHGLSAQCGCWRDWILGMKVVRPDGTVAKCGSKAVKNVAGYDVQKLMIGARGTLGLIAEVTLRTFPLKAMPPPGVEFVAHTGRMECNWIQRVNPCDFERALEADKGHVTAIDRRSSTLWACVPASESITRFEGDWIMRAGCGRHNLEFKDPTVVHLMHRTRDLFDPARKLNRGEMGEE